jgi:hypothetical protein
MAASSIDSESSAAAEIVVDVRVPTVLNARKRTP